MKIPCTRAVKTLAVTPRGGSVSGNPYEPHMTRDAEGGQIARLQGDLNASLFARVKKLSPFFWFTTHTRMSALVIDVAMTKSYHRMNHAKRRGSAATMAYNLGGDRAPAILHGHSRAVVHVVPPCAAV